MILLRTFLVVWAVGLAAAGPRALAQQLAPAPEASTGRTAKSLGTARKYMVAAANPLAAEAGREMLRAGGSALDAAIAVQLVLNLVEPQSSGIGGGAFLVHWSDARRGSLSTLDGRETAPASAKPDDSTSSALTPALPHSLTTPSVWSAGMTRIARSTGSGTSRMLG